MCLASTNLDGILPLVARGKVRDLYKVDENSLLFVATDRISAYDVIMNNGVADKGKILTQLSIFWFDFLKNDIENQLIASDDAEILKRLPAKLSEPKYSKQIAGRSLLVKNLNMIPLEVIVRGYITGSAWKEYKKNGTVHGLPAPEGLRESDPFPHPIFTPSTKAELGKHDENISPEKAGELIGKDLAERVGKVAVKLYSKARDYAKTRGIILADTKFEFALSDNGDIILADEVLTPDSSRFWSAKDYKPGQAQKSYDKQFLRDWLTANKLNGKKDVTMPEDIVKKTSDKYIEAFEDLTGKKWQS
ncbi:Bifunctional purine biosynthetic protein ade1 [Brettanomyces bruxellensis]|uniref:Phosphoribosylaminoimidazole-succinocarboxamide synthase n=1 Tax=Dekkera bruxellensis TaxID=5007 RepID=A0A871RDC6_DEKBR|nr:Bifunctional purine biosynthetic protein ade1 [Brettanomyces bruxellensis]QOU20561.1 Bifunctional purine biosynthetic protein ade1 [Brettanomyces bruxellensis]